MAWRLAHQRQIMVINEGLWNEGRLDHDVVAARPLESDRVPNAIDLELLGLQQEIQPLLHAAVRVVDHAPDDAPMAIISRRGEMPAAADLVAAGDFLRRSGLEKRGKDCRILFVLIDIALRFERKEAEEILVL